MYKPEGLVRCDQAFLFETTLSPCSYDGEPDRSLTLSALVHSLAAVAEAMLWSVFMPRGGQG